MRSMVYRLMVAGLTTFLISCGGGSEETTGELGDSIEVPSTPSPEPQISISPSPSVNTPTPSPIVSPESSPTPTTQPPAGGFDPSPTFAPVPSTAPEPSTQPVPSFEPQPTIVPTLAPIPSSAPAPSVAPAPSAEPDPTDPFPTDPSPLDQCDSTAQCRVQFGNIADDCRDSRSDASVCLCGGERCDTIVAGEPSPEPTVAPVPSPSPTQSPNPSPQPSPSEAPEPEDDLELGDIVNGKTLYIEHCAECHQEDGLSSVFPLNNDTLSFEEMVIAVRDTMPLGNINGCGQACAEDTTAYIKRVLFAENIESLSQPPLVARLVKSQYINTVNDIFEISLSDEEIAFVPDDFSDEAGFVTVFDSQPLQAGHIRAYANIARAVSARLDIGEFFDDLVNCNSTSNNCRDALIETTGKHIFRRPLANNETSLYQGLFNEIREIEGADFNDVGRAVLRAMLQAPQFIYRTEPELAENVQTVTVDAYSLASRLSYFIWQSTPDAQLLAFADDMTANGFDENAYRDEVERLFADDKARRALDTFWADYTLSSSSSIQDADPELAEELRESILRTVKRTSGSGAAPSPLQSLFTSTDFVLSPDLAEALDLPSEGNGYQLYDVSNADERVGFLSHPGFLANIGSTSFVGRGTFLTQRILCRDIPSPPSNIVDEIDDTAEQTLELTPREASDFRFDLGGVCLDCHQRFEPIAAAFEQFDVLGTHSTEDAQGRALFTGGYLQEANGDVGPRYNNVAELMSIIEQSEETSACFVSNMFLFGLGRLYVKDDAAAIGAAHADYIASGGTYEDLLKAVALSPLFRSIQQVSE